MLCHILIEYAELKLLLVTLHTLSPIVFFYEEIENHKSIPSFGNWALISVLITMKHKSLKILLLQIWEKAHVK